NDTTTKPSSTSRRSSMYIEPRVPRKPWMRSTGGASSVTSPNASRRRRRLPRTRGLRYEIPPAPPDRSWPIVLPRPSQRPRPLRRPSSGPGHPTPPRPTQAARVGRSFRDLEVPTSSTISKNPPRDDARALLRVRGAARGGGRVPPPPPLAARTDDPEAGDHV